MKNQNKETGMSPLTNYSPLWSVEMVEQQLTSLPASQASLHYDSTCRRRAANDRAFAHRHQVTSDRLLLSKLLYCECQMRILSALTEVRPPAVHAATQHVMMDSSLFLPHPLLTMYSPQQ